VNGLVESWLVWDLLLCGAVGGLLIFHIVQLALPAPLGTARLALIAFAVSLLSYLFCQRSDLMLALPLALAWPALALCTSGTLWLWLAARGLFDDGFAWRVSVFAAAVAMVALGLAAHGPKLLGTVSGMPDPGLWPWARLHALAQLVLIAATVWEVARGWRDDLVEPRRVVRRWVAMGIAAYAAVVLAVEVAIEGRAVGPLLPALHVLGIGCVALGLAVLVARRSLDDVLGLRAAPPERVPSPASSLPAEPRPTAPRPTSPSLQRVLQGMEQQHLYREDGLTLHALARTLGLGEAALRNLINQELGYRNFNDFLHHYRLREAAARLTAEDRPILTIALECGYGSIGPFNRAFKHRFGVTPTAYRAVQRLAPQATTT
jgi:AraC-like DNA-binding protein